MLDILRSIVQEVNSAKDLKTALGIIVRRIQQTMSTDVCSVYLIDNNLNRYILMATEGLNKSAVSNVSLGISDGLVGQVGLREEPINLEDAPSHPNYYYIRETGEERFYAFLGVPIMHQRKVLGVLVVQQQEMRRFDQGEEAFLITISAQLAGVIAHAEVTGSLSLSGQPVMDVKFSGVSGAPGVAIGPAIVVYPPADLNSVPDKTITDIDQQIHLFTKAVEAVRKDIRTLSNKLLDRLSSEEHALFNAYLHMLDDNALGGEVIDVIKEGQWSQGALRQVIQQHVRNFSLMEDSYLRERAFDVKDLGRRILAYLQESGVQEREFPDNTILVSEELTPAMLGEVPEDKLLGLVSAQGSGNSHVAILARAMGVPTVMGAVDIPYTQLDGRELIIDGYHGTVFSNPTPELRNDYLRIINEEKQLVEGLETLRDLPCETPDFHRMILWVNTGLMADVMRSLDQGAEGVGLYRTEIPFMIHERFPSEQEQQTIYREQLAAFAPNPVTMRTLDIGGDKGLAYFPIKEENPFLGWRGIRVTLDHPEIFLVQIRAMLKASEGLNNLRIMLPMITSVAEVEEALHLIHRAYYEVSEEGINVKMPPVGVMIEVPAAVYQAAELVRLVDFLSVGSNDLTQYLLAVDRNNPRVSDLYHSYHPAVLRALQQIVNYAHAEGRTVSICGEMAGDPGSALLLMAMGYDVLSMSATCLPKVKWVLRGVTLQQAKELLDEVLVLDNAHVIQSCVKLLLKEAGFGRLFRSESAS